MTTRIISDKAYSHLPKKPSSLSNQEWAILIRAKVEDLNALLEESSERDVVVEIDQRKTVIHEHPALYIKTLAERI